MAKKKVSLLGIILLAVAVVGLVLAIVGVCVDYFAFTGEVLGHKSTETMKLFFENSSKDQSDIPVAAVQAFAILALIFAAISTAVAGLNALGVVKIKFLVRLVVFVVTVAMAILALSLGFAYAGQASGSIASAVSMKGTLAAGGWLVPIGAIMSAVPALLVK